MDSLRFTLYGIIAGIISTLIFTIIHEIWISDIWFSFIAMAIAGIVCGAFVSICYQQLFENFIISKWLIYNLIFIIMLTSIGIVSIIYFEPVTTVALLITSDERPDKLINTALPMTAIFTVIFSVIIGLLYAKKPIQYVLIFFTNVLIMAALGLNVSILGLVAIPVDSFILIVELFALIFSIVSVYTIIVILMEQFSIKVKLKSL